MLSTTMKVIYSTLLFITLFPYSECLKIVADSCPACPPCPRRPPLLAVEKSESVRRHSSPDPTWEEEFRRMAVLKEHTEVFAHKTFDLSKSQVKIVTSSPPRKSGEIEITSTAASKTFETTSTGKIRSTIPTATPFVVTINPLLHVLKERNAEKTKKTHPPSTTTATPNHFGRQRLAYIPKDTNDGLTTESSTKTSMTTNIVSEATTTTVPSISSTETVPLMLAGYESHPMFNPDEVTIEEEKCNDTALQKILVEGMRVDDSVGSKRSIGALLTVARLTTVSVLCSEEQMAFRLIARKHCQLSAGKATCVMFVL